MNGNQYLILSVEDSMVFQNLISKALTAAGHIVLCAGNGKEALETLSDVSPDLILLDVVMPGLSGYETARLIKEMPGKETIPMMFLTTESDKNAEMEGLKIGAYDYIFKPFVPEILIKRVENAIEHAQLETEFKRQLDIKAAQLNKAAMQSVELVAMLVDGRSGYTAGHSSCVSRVSALIAEKLGWETEQIEDLVKAALLHDIGNVSVPDSVFTKEGPLSEEEYAAVKRHTTIGSDILKNTPTFKNVIEGVRWHHERYDGKGYPDGLAGKNIPVAARIICVADAVDAMASDRPHRKAFSNDEIKAELKLCSGTQFDPQIAEAAISLIDSGIDLKSIPDDIFLRGSQALEGNSLMKQIYKETYGIAPPKGTDSIKI